MIQKLYPYIKKILIFCSDINWTWLKKVLVGREFDLSEEDQQKIKHLLTNNYYVILIRRDTHLTTYLISLGSFIKTFKFGFWGHALCNVEDDVKTDDDYKLVEATKTGVHFSKFGDVFNCDSVALMRPKYMPLAEYTTMLDDYLSEIGKEYDFILDVSNSERVSCVEVIYAAIIRNESQDKFPNLMKMVKEIKNLTPDMLYDCNDFIVDFEVRK